jgi:FkbM family methyltransferase
MALGQKLRNTKAGLKDIMNFDNRWEIVLRRLMFRSTGIITYRKNGMEIVVDHHGGDEVGTRACLVSGMYRRLLPMMTFDGQINLIDIGANGGGFPLMLADAGYTLNKIVAVEMNPRVFARMQLNVTQNLDVKSYLFNAAIAGETQIIEAEMGRGSTGESISGSMGHSSRGAARKALIRGMTFDELFDHAFAADEVADLCKMDVEGSEYDVLSGGHCTRLARCRYLIIEIHAVHGADPEIVVAAIKKLGLVEMPRPKDGERDVYCFHNPSLT